MIIDNDIKLDFNDVLLKPKRSTLVSRAQVDLVCSYTTKHSNRTISGIPIIAANMDSVGTFKMADQLNKHLCFTALHKHYTDSQLLNFFSSGKPHHAFYSMGTSDSDYEKFNKVKSQIGTIPTIVLDVANGYTQKFVDTIKHLRDTNPSTTLIAGNVVSGEMTEELILSGADIVKIGIGSGSACLTRTRTVLVCHNCQLL